MKSTPRVVRRYFGINGEFDCPEVAMVCLCEEWEDGRCKVTHICKDKNRVRHNAFYIVGKDTPVPVLQFGVRLMMDRNGRLGYEQFAESRATYSDGVPRKWQQQGREHWTWPIVPKMLPKVVDLLAKGGSEDLKVGRKTPTEKQIEILRHALGSSHSDTPLGWRNYYCASVEDPDCTTLVALGLLEAGRTLESGENRYFIVTEEGIKLAREGRYSGLKSYEIWHVDYPDVVSIHSGETAAKAKSSAAYSMADAFGCRVGDVLKKLRCRREGRLDGIPMKGQDPIAATKAHTEFFGTVRQS